MFAPKLLRRSLVDALPLKRCKEVTMSPLNWFLLELVLRLVSLCLDDFQTLWYTFTVMHADSALHMPAIAAPLAVIGGHNEVV